MNSFIQKVPLSVPFSFDLVAYGTGGAEGETSFSYDHICINSIIIYSAVNLAKEPCRQIQQRQIK